MDIELFKLIRTHIIEYLKTNDFITDGTGIKTSEDIIDIFINDINDYKYTKQKKIIEEVIGEFKHE